jgi:peptidyl-prolyl cis-trans isomerase C
MHTSLRFAAAAALAFAALNAGAQALPPETPLLEDRGTRVSVADFEGYLLRIPEAERLVFRSSPERVATVVDTLFITRTLAQRAREQGLDKSPEIQARLAQLQEGLLADLYMQQVEKETPVPNLEQRSRELYKTDAKAFAVPEQVGVQHILINLNGRTRDMALARAKEVHREVVNSKEDFATLAKRYSDDPDVRRNNGDLGIVNPASLEPGFAQALAKMAKGEISEPAETKYGFHIIRVTGRKAATTVPFESVRDKMIAAERAKIMAERRQQVVSEIRESKTVMLHRNNVDAMRSQVDLSKAGAGVPLTPSAPGKK